jgi:[CysO sulfur-carrier protein]-S-L-cysteine hydrolase
MSQRRSRLVFSQQTLDEMIELAWSAYPAEAVGLVGGIGGTVKSVYGLRNLAHCGAFFADPYDQYQALQRMTLSGERLMATFHSHPEGAAELSEVDREYVFEVATTAIVIAVRAAGHTAHIAALSRATGMGEAVVEIVVQG